MGPVSASIFRGINLESSVDLERRGGTKCHGLGAFSNLDLLSILLVHPYNALRYVSVTVGDSVGPTLNPI